MKCEHNVNSECRLPAFPGDKLIAGNQNARQEHQDQQDRHQRSDADGIHNGGDRRILEKPATIDGTITRISPEVVIV